MNSVAAYYILFVCLANSFSPEPKCEIAGIYLSEEACLKRNSEIGKQAGGMVLVISSCERLERK